jgi:hypothetical protein
MDLSVIAVWYDPNAILNLAAAAGNPYRGDVTGLEVNKEMVPPIGTKLTLVFIPTPRPSAKGD